MTGISVRVNTQRGVVNLFSANQTNGQHVTQNEMSKTESKF